MQPSCIVRPARASCIMLQKAVRLMLLAKWKQSVPGDEILTSSFPDERARSRRPRWRVQGVGPLKVNRRDDGLRRPHGDDRAKASGDCEVRKRAPRLRPR